MPIEIAKKKLREESGIRLSHFQRFEDLERALLERPQTFVIFYNELPDVSAELKSVLMKLEEHLRNQQACLLVIAARNVHKIRLVLKHHRGVVVVPNTVQPGQLVTSISSLLQQAGPAAVTAAKPNTSRAVKPNLKMVDGGKANVGFKPLEQPELINEMFIDVIHSKSAISLFDETLQIQFKAHATKYNPLTSELQVSIQNLAQPLQYYFPWVILVNVNLRRCRGFFKVTQFVQTSSNAITFKITEPIYEVQRRSHIRLVLTDEPPISFNLSHPEVLLKARVFDVSAGGVGVLIDAEIAKHLRVKTQLNNIEFMVGHREFRITKGFVRYLSAQSQIIDGKPYLKVGVQFENLRPSDRAFLSMYVYRESLKVFG